MEISRAVFLTAVVLSLAFFKCRGYLFRGAAFTAVTGIFSLYGFQAAQSYLGFGLPVTMGTLTTCGAFGVPGTIFLLFSQVFAKIGWFCH